MPASNRQKTGYPPFRPSPPFLRCAPERLAAGLLSLPQKKGLAIKTRPFFNSKIFYKTRSFQQLLRHTLRYRYSSGVSLRMKHKFPLARNAHIFRKRKTAETCGCNYFMQAPFFYKTRSFQLQQQRKLRYSRPLGCCPFP